MIRKLDYRVALINLLFVPLFSGAEPYLMPGKQLDYGTLLGHSGGCYLDPATEILTTLSGSFCPSWLQKGTRAEYVIYGDPFTTIRIKFNIANIVSDSLYYTPDGIFVVSGMPDVDMNANTFHDIDTGSSGNITIYVGGTMSSSIDYPASYSYSYNFENAFEWNVL